MCIYIYILNTINVPSISVSFAQLLRIISLRGFNGLISDGANGVIITEKPVPSLYIHSTLSSAD